jgi:opacity protein-like surface antigen
MRAIVGAMFSLLLVASAASGQSLLLHGSAGPTLIDSGFSAAGGIGFSPASRLTVLLGAERSHLSSRVTSDGRRGESSFRGGTFTAGTAELRIELLGRDRVSPYLLGGVAAGVSRPNVNQTFPDSVTNNVRAFFFGGGIHVPLRERISLFGDARMIVGDETGELLAILPVRVGLAVRF